MFPPLQLHNLQAPLFANQDNLPSWTKFSLKRSKDPIKYSAGVIMGDYLVVLVQEEKERIFYKYDEVPREDQASLLAFNLLDQSVQKARINTRSLIYQEDYYSFLKYGENQIVKYGGQNSNCSLVCITIKSFEPFKVECEEIKDQNSKNWIKGAAQIYKDCLYVYERMKEGDLEPQLWSFNLKKRTWKFVETIGEAPGFHNVPQSFIYEDNLFVYGVDSDINDLFMLSFDSMEWTRIEQVEDYLAYRDSYELQSFGGAVYKDHLAILRRTTLGNTLCFLDLEDQTTWSTFDVQGLNKNYAITQVMTGGLMVYQDFVLSLAVAGNDPHKLIVAMMSLENFGISARKSAEEKHISGLFMSEDESDVAFKVDEKVIPAHKTILIKKSRYFEGVFKSGMAETAQEIIEIKDCEYEIFKEYLRFLYQDTVNFEDEDPAMKLYVLADKYLQEDLCKECLKFLASRLNMNTIYKMLDFFAHDQNVPEIRLWCTKLLKERLSLQNVERLTKYLVDHQEDPEFKENNKEIFNQALSFVLENFIDINKKKDTEIYEDFLVKNIDMDTISALANFLGEPLELPEKANSLGRTAARIRKEAFEERVTRIKEAIFDFVHENLKTLMTSKMAREFPNGFFVEFTLYSAERTAKEIQELKEKMSCVEGQGNSEEIKKGNGKKRMEPVQGNDEEEEEIFELKKTKKSDPKWRVI